MLYKKIALFFLLLFCSDQILPMENTSVNEIDLSWKQFFCLVASGAVIELALLAIFKDKIISTIDKIIRRIWLYKFSKPSSDPNMPFVDYDENYTLLHVACKEGDLAAVTTLLKNPLIDPNKKRISNSNTPLHLACENLDRDIIQLLLKHPKTDPNIHNVGDKTPLSTLCYKLHNEPLDENSTKTLELILLFLDNPRTDFNLSVRFNYNDGYRSFLSWACEKKYTEIIKQLLIRPNFRVTVNDLFDTYEHAETFELLCSHSSTNPADIFLVAIQKQDEKIVEQLLTENDFKTLDPHNRALHETLAVTGNINIFKKILAKNAIDVNSLQYINHASHYGERKTPLHYAVKRNHYEIVKLLLQQKHIKLDVNSSSGTTPLETAIESAITEKNISTHIIQALCEHTPGIVNCKNKRGDTFLIYAARIKYCNQMNQINIVNFLINNCNADIWLTGSCQKTFFYRLIRRYPKLDLNELTFFKKYNQQKKISFLTAQLENVIKNKYSDSKIKYKNSEIKATPIEDMLGHFIAYCKTYEVNFNQRNKSEHLPLDIAYKKYVMTANCTHPKSAQFCIAEKIYHTLLKETIYPHLLSNHLYYDILPHARTIKEEPYHRITWALSEASGNTLHTDALKHIMRYYCSLQARDIINHERKQLGLLTPANS